MGHNGQIGNIVEIFKKNYYLKGEKFSESEAKNKKTHIFHTHSTHITHINN